MPDCPASNHGDDVPQFVQTKRYALIASTERASGHESWGHSARCPPRYLSQRAAVASCDRSPIFWPWGVRPRSTMTISLLLASGDEVALLCTEDPEYRVPNV